MIARGSYHERDDLMRPMTILTVAGLLAISAFGLATWATDPAWARAAGLDVWNASALEEELRAIHAERQRLDDQEAMLLHILDLTEQIIQETAAQRRSLADAAEVLLRINRDRPGFASVLDLHFQGPTPSARVAHYVLFKIEVDRRRTPAEKEPLLQRLRAEYTATFGVPAPSYP